MHELGRSELEAEELVDTLEMHGYLRFVGDPSSRSQAEPLGDPARSHLIRPPRGLWSTSRPWTRPRSAIHSILLHRARGRAGTALGSRCRRRADVHPDARRDREHRDRPAGGHREPSRRCVDGVATLGGSQADTIAVPGLPPAALRLEPCAAGWWCVPRWRACGSPDTRWRRARQAAPAGGTRDAPRPRARAAPGATGTGRPASSRPRSSGSRWTGRAFPAGPHLVVLTGGDVGERIALRRGACHRSGSWRKLRIRDPAASRRHARVDRGPAGATVEDLGAKNRLRVNGVARRAAAASHSGRDDRTTRGRDRARP